MLAMIFISEHLAAQRDNCRVFLRVDQEAKGTEVGEVAQVHSWDKGLALHEFWQDLYYCF